MKKSPLLAVSVLLLLSQNAMAGWYKVENFVGSIDARPVHLSLQTYDFGSGISVEGSYYFDDERQPVVVYGTIEDGAMKLCEISSAEQFHDAIIQGSASAMDLSGCATFLSLDERGAAGTWDIGGVPYPVTFDRVARLDDTGTGEMEGIVEIPFWQQTASHTFLGIYSNEGGVICMEKMQVINKSSLEVDQEIAFDDPLCDAGAVMTQIYLNVETYLDGQTQFVTVNFRGSGYGYAVGYVADPKTGLLSESQ